MNCYFLEEFNYSTGRRFFFSKQSFVIVRDKSKVLGSKTFQIGEIISLTVEVLVRRETARKLKLDRKSLFFQRKFTDNFSDRKDLGVPSTKTSREPILTHCDENEVELDRSERRKVFLSGRKTKFYFAEFFFFDLKSEKVDLSFPKRFSIRF